MQVKEVISFLDQTNFIDFPRKIYKNDPEWISHLDNDIEDIFNSAKNQNFLLGAAKRFFVINDDEILGRIAVFYKLEEGFNKGGIGFFECINEQKVANLLFDTSKNWLITQGCLGMDGPINFGEKDKYWGLLVKGFKNPSYQENYNSPYYQSLFENYGFERIFEQTTSEITLKDFNYERVNKLSARVFKNPSYRFEHYKDKELKKFASDFIHIYNKAWASRPDFSPITLNRIESTLVAIKPILIEEAIWFVYANDEPAGFYVNVLDVNQIFKHVKGKMDFWGKLKFLFYREFGKINRIRGIVFGIIPEYQNLGLETGMIINLYNSLREKHPNITQSELSWIGDFNPKMHSLFNALGAKTTKIHYTYHYNFSNKRHSH
ncbi:MAG: GNAT family N-acetyltransferase [Bacteroidia bacterium]|nr:GNAT family N-acetyltransferase [Bacteroidia bacterium]MCF8425523.1 GNAT family N-acetyltransferase [Bacteroidia bacterium]MCF8445836.1 GNAT family N-acetyltransferase [Bacteroidia bacterium]